MLNVTTLPLGDYQTNCYIVRNGDSDRCVVIDPGYESPRLNAALEGLQVEAILLTHGHFDHVGGIRSLVMEHDCPVYVGQGEKNLPPMMSAGPLYYTNLMNDGDQLDIAGLTVTVMATPGHSPGSVCLFIGDTLFSGDTLFAGTCGRTDLPGSDPEDMMVSLKQLSRLEQDFIVRPGHGESSTLLDEKRYNPYLN